MSVYTYLLILYYITCIMYFHQVYSVLFFMMLIPLFSALIVFRKLCNLLQWMPLYDGLCLFYFLTQPSAMCFVKQKWCLIITQIIITEFNVLFLAVPICLVWWFHFVKTYLSHASHGLTARCVSDIFTTHPVFLGGFPAVSPWKNLTLGRCPRRRSVVQDFLSSYILQNVFMDHT